MKNLADISCSRDSQVLDKKDKTGHCYIRTDTVSGRKFHMLKSSGKHLNAALSFMEYFQKDADRVLQKRCCSLNQVEKLLFFQTLECLAASDELTLGMMKLSDVAKTKLNSGTFNDCESKKLLADLILIVVNKNQAHVKAIAANYRRCSRDGVPDKTCISLSKSHQKPHHDELADVTNSRDDNDIEVVNEIYSDVEPD